MNLLQDLESNNIQKVEDVKWKLKELFNSNRDPWLLNGLYDHILTTNFSLRAIEVLVVVKEPHDRYYFERTLEGIRSPNKLLHLTLLGYVVRKNPIWLHKIFHHPLIRELLRLLKVEMDIVIVVSALLILNILIPAMPGLVGPLLEEIFSVFSKLAAMNTNSKNYNDVELVHLQISLYTLFHRLYGMFPCNFLTFLRKEYSNSATSPVFSHTVKPMLDTVRLNPWLITANEEWEKMSSRWRNMESHDIIVSCARLLMNGGSSTRELHQTTMYEPKSTFHCKDLLDTLKVTGKQSVSDYCKQLSKSSVETPLWSPSGKIMDTAQHIESTPTMIPLTPILRGFEVSSPYSEHGSSSPPEAAVEATPETTPIGDNVVAPLPVLITTANRSALSFTKDSIQYGSKVPINERSFPTSPIKKESSAFRNSAPEIVPIAQASRKVNLLLTDRNQATSPVSVVELKPLVVQSANNTNDLIGNQERTSVISCANASSSFVDGVSNDCNGQSNGLGSRTSTDATIVEPIDDFDACEPEKSGSPCSSGGLHMPDNRSLCNFALQMTRIRSRHYSQCNSDSDRYSPGNSPQDGVNYFQNSKVRRANSCPEMKKSSPNSVAVAPASNSPANETVFHEEDENCIENCDNEKLCRRKKNQFSKKVTSGTQTDEAPPPTPAHFPYEHLFLDVFPPLHPPLTCDQISPTGSENSLEERSSSIYESAYAPSKLLQKYIEAAVQCHNDKLMLRENIGRMNPLIAENKYLINMLKLMGVQLQLEEHKREIHAERNRRLLGRSRRNKTLEEHNNALKDQITVLQRDIEHSNAEVLKIVTEKEAIVVREQKAAAYWKEQFVGLQKEYNIISNRYQKIEAQLKEEKDSNEHNQKQLHESRAALGDITNDLRSFQKEAMEAKVLRNTVSELQAEVLKSGELITNYRNRLNEISVPIDQEVQLNFYKKAYFEEIEQLKRVINAQKLSLEASQSLVVSLRKEIEAKENYSENLKKTSEAAVKTLKNEIKNLKEELDKTKELYDRQVQRANDLESKLSHAKRVTRLSNAVLAPRNVDYASKLNSALSSEDGGSKLAQGGPRSPKRVVSHSDTQQLNLFFKTCPEPERSQMAAAAETSKESSPKSAKAGPSVKPSISGESAPLKEPDTEPTDMFKSNAKKKTRMECAETGQLRSISFAYIDPEQASGKNND